MERWRVGGENVPDDFNHCWLGGVGVGWGEAGVGGNLEREREKEPDS